MSISSFDFSHYFSYEEIVSFLNSLEQWFPDLIEIRTIGKTYEGKKILLAVLTNKKTGSALDKPGYWIDANTHAGEVTGSAVALYIAHYLLTKYQQNARATRLLDDYTIYVVPRLAIDAAEKYLKTPNSFRSSVRHHPETNKNEGLYSLDINNDGLILNMRIKDPCGSKKVSKKDSRIMVRREPDEFGDTYYMVVPEGIINNYNGYNIKLAKPLEGMDFNRNYPYEWKPEGIEKGSGYYPFSEPETRALGEFWAANRNINGFITYHTYSSVILRPYCNNDDDNFSAEDLEIYKLIGEKGTQTTGYPCVSVNSLFNKGQKKIRGSMSDYCYEYWGWFGFTIELWDLPTAIGIEKEDYVEWYRHHSEEDDLKLMAWNDEILNGKGFINWQPFEHPQLGLVEIGGWNYKLLWQNAPPTYLPDICSKQCEFAIAHALMSPRIVISDITVVQKSRNIYSLGVIIENEGFLPTYTSKKSLTSSIVKPIEANILLPEYCFLITGQLRKEIGHLEGRANKSYCSYESSDYRCYVEWVVKIEESCKIQITVNSERAGTCKSTVDLLENKN